MNIIFLYEIECLLCSVCLVNLNSLGQKKNMCVYCHMLKKIRVGRSEIIFFYFIFFFISELILDGIWNAFLHFKSDT